MFMEMLSAIAPFFMAGLLGTVFARFTGINMSMCVLLMFLYMGAKPVECIAAMLMFNVFTYFTVYSQLHIMKIKSFTFFPGVRLAIPILITIALAALNPFIGIVFFVFTFLMEIFAKIYKEMDAKFVKEAAEAGLVNLKGHRTVGGMRASIYNAMPMEGVEKLVEFMKKFEEAHQA